MMRTTGSDVWHWGTGEVDVNLAVRSTLRAGEYICLYCHSAVGISPRHQDSTISRTLISNFFLNNLLKYSKTIFK